MSVWDTVPGLLKRHRELYDAGRTHLQISRILTAEFGVNVSRNASIGKAARTGYPPRARKGTQTGTGREGKPRKLKSKPLPKPKPEGHAMNITLLQLTDHTCKWPVSGEGADTRFCGHASEYGSSYCAAHRKRSINQNYVPAKDWLRKVA